MSEEENVFLQIRKHSGGMFDRGYSDIRSIGETQGGNITKLLESSPRNWQGTVNIGSGRHPDVQYASGPFEALTRKTDTDVFVENAPYYAAIAGTALFGGAVIGGAAAGVTEGLALPVVAKGALDTSAFLLGASGTGLATQAGLGLAGIDDATSQDRAFSPGAMTAAQALPTAALFGNLAIPKTLGEVAGAGIFGGTVAGHSLITGAFDPNRTTAQVAADAAIEGVEGLAFGLFARPTSLGRPILGAGHYVGQNNPIYRGAVRSIYTDNGRAGTWDNSHGRGGIAPNGTGGIAGYEPARPEGDGTIGVREVQQATGVGPAAAPEAPRIVPTASGRGDATHYDPLNGTITVTSAMPDGTSRVTVYTNMAGQKVKAKGPYANTPDVFTVNIDKFGNIIGPSGPQEPGLAPPTWSENAAANEAAARTAEKNATRKQWQAESVPAAEVVPPAPQSTPPPPAPKPAGATPPPAPAAASTPAEAVAGGGTTGTNVDPLLRAAQSRHDAAQEAERQAGASLTAAGADYAQAIKDEADNPSAEARQRRIDANKREADALIALERAQMEAEAASKNLEETKKGLVEAAAQRQAQKDSVEPRPDINSDWEGYKEWVRKYKFTNDPTTGRKLTAEEVQKLKDEQEGFNELLKAETQFEKENNIDRNIPRADRRVTPRDSMKTEPGIKLWDSLHSLTHNADGTPKSQTPAEAVVAPTAEAQPKPPAPAAASTPAEAVAEVATTTAGDEFVPPAPVPVPKSGIPRTADQVDSDWADFLFQNFGEAIDVVGGWDGLRKQENARKTLSKFDALPEEQKKRILELFEKQRLEFNADKEKANVEFGENVKLADAADLKLQKFIEGKMAEGLSVDQIKQLPEYKNLQSEAQAASKKATLRKSFEERKRRNLMNQTARDDAALILAEKPENRGWRYRDLLSQDRDDYKPVLDARLKKLGIMSESGEFTAKNGAVASPAVTAETTTPPATTEVKPTQLNTSSPRPPDLRQFVPATRDEVLAGTRPVSEAPRDVVAALTAEERKTVIRNRKQFLETGEKPKFDIPPPVVESPKPVVVEQSAPAETGKPPAEAGKTVVEPTAETTVAKDVPVTPTSPVQTPAAAAAKIDDEVERLVDLGDAKTADEVKKKVVNTLEELLKQEQENPTQPLEVKIPEITKYESGFGKSVVQANGKQIGTLVKEIRNRGNERYSYIDFKPSKNGLPGVGSLSDWNDNIDSYDKPGQITKEDFDKILKQIEKQIAKQTERDSDNRKYVIRIPGDGTFSVRRNVDSIQDVLNRISKGAAENWKGVVGRPKTRGPSSSQLRGPKFSPKLTAQDKKQLEELLKEQEATLAEGDASLSVKGINKAELQESIENLKKALAEGGGPEQKSLSPAIPDPQGRKGVLVQSAVVGTRDNTDKLQVVGVDGPTEIHRGGMKNPEPLELESPGGKSSESWPAYQMALGREGAKNVYIVRLPGTKEGGKEYNMAITGFISIKFKKGQGGGVIPVLNSVGLEDDNKSTKHWLNWKIVEFYPEVSDNRAEGAERWIYGNPQYSSNLAESGGKIFGEIQNTAEAKKEFIERLFSTFEVFVPGDFNREDSTYGFDGKPTLYFNQSAMIAAEAAAKQTPSAQETPPREMTVEEHWDAEKDREEAAKKVRTPRATEAPETAKTKAQIDAETKAEGAKRYGASGVRFNIGGPKNPESFGGEIRGQKGVVVASTPQNWNEKDLKLIKDYLSPDAAVLRNMGYPKFYFNSQISGEDSNWVSAPVPAANGNFLVYEVNPKGSGASGNSYKRTVRLFRRLVNADGKQIGSMTEVSQGELVGMSTVSLADDGKPLFQVPAIFHAMMRAAQDSLASREMTESSVNYGGDVTNPNPLNARIALSGTIHEDLTTFEENGLTPPGLRDKMEVFNGLKSGESINAAIIGFIGNPDVASSSLLSSQLQTNGLLAAADAQALIADLAAAMGMEPGTYALVTSPHDDELYPILKRQGIYPTEARLMLKWIQNGYQRIIFEVGKHDPETGLELPDKVQRVVNGVPSWLPKPGPNGEKLPLMINNPLKWRAPVTQWMAAEDFTVRDKDGNITFQPKPHQVVGPNMAMTRWFPAGVDSAPRDLKVGMPKAILINDAPGTGKTLQMLMAAVLYRKQLEKLVKDPTSKWYGQKLQPVLIVTQNAQIIQNAFRGDAAMAGIDLNGKFTPEGFEPDEYEDTPEGRILKGNSWIDIATYSSIKPTEEKVPLFEKDGKTPKMVNALVRNEAGNPQKGPDGKYQIAYHPTEVDDKGMPVPLKEQAFRMVRIGPPKKGAGKWGAIMFDESHNMKNDTSARSDAGFEIMSKSQHVMLASGTPIDKPTQLGPILGMLLDMPMEEIAAKLGMKLSTTKRSDDVLLRKRGPDDGAPIMEKPKLEYGTMPADPIEREKAYNNLFIKLRALRDEAGKAGAILRRSTKYFGVDNIWLDPTDSFHPEGKKALLALQTWWFNEMALGAEGETGMNPRNMRGMLLFESKRLTSLIKCGIPNTPWNPSDEPRGAAKLMLDEIKEGRKVIITMDTSNPFNLDDTVNIRRFRGLKTTENAPLPYESEAVLWGRYLDKLGIKFGSITGDFSIAEREVTVREFQKNNPDLQVIIMTTQSGGTGLSIDDRHGVGGKTNPKKQYTDAEIARMKQVGAEEIEGEKIPSGSFPRTMIIVSSPWGGDVFIQAMGRTDRVLATTPSRIIVMTSHISEGDEKLADLVRMKTMATNAINETGDELAVAVMMDAAENGAGMQDADGLKPVKEIGGVKASTVSETSEDVKYFKNKAKQTIKRNSSTVSGVIAENKQKLADAKKNNSTNREITRWQKTVEVAEDYVRWLKDISKGLDDGSFDYRVIVKNPDDFSYEKFKENRPTGEGLDPDAPLELDVEGEFDEGFDYDGGNPLSLDLPLGQSLMGRQGLPANLGALARKGKPNKARRVIDRLYGVHHLASGGRMTAEQLQATENTMIDIVEPFLKIYEEGNISPEKMKSLMRMASDVAFLVHKYEFIFKKADVEVRYGGQMNFAGRAILKLLKPDTLDKISTVYHEIGHALWEVVNDTDKQRIVDEMLQARKAWLNDMSEGSPMKALVLPEVDFREPQGLENSSFTKVPVEKAPVPYARKRKYVAVAQQANSGLFKNVPNAPTIKDVVGTGLASKAVSIALKNALLAGWKSPDKLPLALQDPMYKEFFGAKGQVDIIEHGKTPAERATKALMAIFQARMIRNTDLANDKMDVQVNKVDALDLSTGQPIQNAALSLKDIYYLTAGGKGIYDVSADGSLTITSRIFLAGVGGSTRPTWKYNINRRYNTSDDIANAPGMVRYSIPGNMVYSMFVQTFGGMSPTSKNANLIFQNPDFQSATFCTQANSVAEVASGIADHGMIGHNYKYINVDEWLANNTEELFNDFYGLNEPDDFTGLTASITSSLFTHASAGGYGSVVKSIVAGLVGGTIEPVFDEPALSLSGSQWHANKLRNEMDAQAAANAPPAIDGNNLSIDKDPMLGPARRKFESAIEGLNAIAASLAETALDFNIVKDSVAMRKWFEQARRRKRQTGKPDNVTGFGINYKFQHIYGTLIGQVEQIAEITRDPYVAELSKRLYPSVGTGLNVRPTYTEDVYAFTSFWNNRFNDIIRRNLGELISQAKDDKVRRIEAGAEKLPGFVDGMAQYILKAHNPIFNRLERIQFEIDAIPTDPQGNKKIPAPLAREIKSLGLASNDWAGVQPLIDAEIAEARREAAMFGRGSSYDKVALGREADAFLGEFMEKGGIDKLMMDVGRCQGIPKDSPEYATRAQRFEPEVIAAADELIDGWSSAFIDWSRQYGDVLAEWGSSWVPRIADSQLVASYGNAAGDDFVLTAAKAMLEDNKFQRVRLPSSLKTPIMDMTVSSQFVNSSKMKHVSKSEVQAFLQGFIDPKTGQDTFQYPQWMVSRAQNVLTGSRQKESFMGFDVSCVQEVNGMLRIDVDPVSGTRVDTQERTTIGHHIAANLHIYRNALIKQAISAYGSVSKALRIESFRREYEMVGRTIGELSESHERKVLAGPLSQKDAIAIAKKWRERIEHRASGVQASGQGYADLFGGQHGTMKTPDSMKQRQMDTAAADKILERFYIRDPRVFGPNYNESVVRNLMLKKHIPEGFFERMQKSIISNPDNRRFWPEITYLMAKITDSQQSHDSSTFLRSMVTFAAATTFMSKTAALQLSESMPAGLHSPSGASSDNIFQQVAGLTLPGVKATAETVKIAIHKSINATIRAGAMLTRQAVDNNVAITHIDQFMYRLAERTGVIMSTYMEDIPQSSADPRSMAQKFVDNMITRYHRNGNILATITDVSRVAVLKGNVLMLETTADEILMRELTMYGKNGAPDEVTFAKLLKPLEVMLLRNLGIPDANLKPFLKHALVTRSITEQDISKIPSYMIESTLRTLVDSGFEYNNVEAQLYTNALNRLNTLSIQRSSPATMSRLRGLVDRHVGVFAGSNMFFLTNFSSAFGRNIVLPMSRLISKPFYETKKVLNAGMQEPKQFTPGGTYLTNIAYPLSHTMGYKMLPAVILMMASTTYVNFYTRQLRMQVASDPASTYMDQRTPIIRAAAAVDQAGFTANLSLPLNVAQALRYQREAAQIAAGPFWGNIAGVVDMGRTLLSDKNSENTPTAERAFAKIAYDTIVRPVGQAILQMVTPNNILGDMVNLSATQYMAMPSTRESFMRWFAEDAGNQGKRVPPTKSDLLKAYQSNLINREQYMAGLRERALYDSQYEREKAIRDRNAAFERRKESQGK